MALPVLLLDPAASDFGAKGRPHSVAVGTPPVALAAVLPSQPLGALALRSVHIVAGEGRPCICLAPSRPLLPTAAPPPPRCPPAARCTS